MKDSCDDSGEDIIYVGESKRGSSDIKAVPRQRKAPKSSNLPPVRQPAANNSNLSSSFEQELIKFANENIAPPLCSSEKVCSTNRVISKPASSSTITPRGVTKSVPKGTSSRNSTSFQKNPVSANQTSVIAKNPQQQFVKFVHSPHSTSGNQQSTSEKQQPTSEKQQPTAKNQQQKLNSDSFSVQTKSGTARVLIKKKGTVCRSTPTQTSWRLDPAQKFFFLKNSDQVFATVDPSICEAIRSDPLIDFYKKKPDSEPKVDSSPKEPEIENPLSNFSTMMETLDNDDISFSGFQNETQQAPNREDYQEQEQNPTRIFRPNESQQKVNNLNYNIAENPLVVNGQNTPIAQVFTNINPSVKQPSVQPQPITTIVSKPRPVQNMNHLTPFSTQAPSPRQVQRNASPFEQGQSRVQSSPLNFSVPPPQHRSSRIMMPAVNNMGSNYENYNHNCGNHWSSNTNNYPPPHPQHPSSSEPPNYQYNYESAPVPGHASFLPVNNQLHLPTGYNHTNPMQPHYNNSKYWYNNLAVPHMEYTDQQSGWDYYNPDPAVYYYPPLAGDWIGGHNHGYHNQPAVPFQFGNNFPTGHEYQQVYHPQAQHAHMNAVSQLQSWQLQPQPVETGQQTAAGTYPSSEMQGSERASWQPGWNENQSSQWQNYYQEPQLYERQGEEIGQNPTSSSLNYTDNGSHHYDNSNSQYNGHEVSGGHQSHSGHNDHFSGYQSQDDVRKNRTVLARNSGTKNMQERACNSVILEMREPETTSSGNSARPQNSPQGGAHIGVPSSVESVTKQLFMSPDSACDVMSPEEFRDNSLQDDGRPNVYSQIFSMPYSSKVLENKSAKATIEKTKKRGKQGITGDESKIKKPKISKNENIKISNTTNENEKKSANQNKQKSTKVEHEQLKECKLLDGKTIELTSDCVQLPERKRDPKQETPKYKVPLWRKNELKDLENYRGFIFATSTASRARRSSGASHLIKARHQMAKIISVVRKSYAITVIGDAIQDGRKIIDLDKVAERVEGNEICSLDSFAKIFGNIHDKTAAVFKPEHDYVRCTQHISDIVSTLVRIWTADDQKEMDKTIDPTGSNSQEALVNALKEMDVKSSAKAKDPPQSKRSRRNNAGDKKQFLKIKYPDFDVNCSSEDQAANQTDDEAVIEEQLEAAANKQMSARKSRKGSPIPKKSAPKSRNDSASGRNKRGRPAKNKTDENYVRRSLRSRSNSRVDRPNYKECSTDSDIESAIKQLPIIPNNDRLVAASQDIPENIEKQEERQNIFPLKEAEIVQTEDYVEPRKAEEKVKDPIEPTENLTEQNIEAVKKMEESKNKKSRNKPVYRKILTIKDINVKNLDTSEKNGANEQTLKHPSSAAANNISKDTNTNEIRNHEGEITQEPRINLTTILRGIRKLKSKTNCPETPLIEGENAENYEAKLERAAGASGCSTHNTKDLKAKTDVIGKRGRQKRKVEDDSNLKIQPDKSPRSGGQEIVTIEAPTHIHEIQDTSQLKLRKLDYDYDADVCNFHSIDDSLNNARIDDSFNNAKIDDTQANASINDSLASATIDESQANVSIDDSFNNTKIDDTLANAIIDDTQANSTIDEYQTNASNDESLANETIGESQAIASIDESQANATIDDTQANATNDDTQANATIGESQSNTTIGNTQANASIDESEANAIIDDTHDKGEKIKTPVTRKVTRSSSRNARKIDAMEDNSLGLEASDTPKFSNVIDSVKLSRNQPRRSSRASVPRVLFNTPVSMRKTAVKTPTDDQQIAFVTPKPAVFGTPKRGVFSTPKRGVFCTPKSGAATKPPVTNKDDSTGDKKLGTDKRNRMEGNQPSQEMYQTRGKRLSK